MSKMRELFERKRAQAAAELAAAEAAAHAAGKEPFDWARFRGLLRYPAPSGNELEHRTAYYVRYPELLRITEYVATLEDLAPWDDSR
jgi:hypothetical protein